MSIDNKKPLVDFIDANDVVGAMSYLKANYGVAEGFICSNANVKLSTYSRYKKGDIKVLGADKVVALLDVLRRMYL